jgi:hypothetical protein
MDETEIKKIKNNVINNSLPHKSSVLVLKVQGWSLRGIFGSFLIWNL